MLSTRLGVERPWRLADFSALAFWAGVSCWCFDFGFFLSQIASAMALVCRTPGPAKPSPLERRPAGLDVDQRRPQFGRSRRRAPSRPGGRHRRRPACPTVATTAAVPDRASSASAGPTHSTHSATVPARAPRPASPRSAGQAQQRVARHAVEVGVGQRRGERRGDRRAAGRSTRRSPRYDRPARTAPGRRPSAPRPP